MFVLLFIQPQVVSIILIEMVHMFKSMIEQILICLSGNVIVAIHRIVSIQETQYYFMFKMLVGHLVIIIIFFCPVVRHQEMSFVHQNHLLSLVFVSYLLRKYSFISFLCMIVDPNFWNFNIWDPGLSSTTSTTTTPPTTGTVTTRVSFFSE